MDELERVQNSSTKGFFSLLGAAFIYGTFGILIRYISPGFGDNFQIVVRFFLAFLFIFFFNRITKQTKGLPKRVFLKAMILGIISAIITVFFTYSVLNTKLTNSVVLLYAGSLTSSFLIGTFYFKESVTKTKLATFIIAFIGIAMYSDALFSFSFGILTGLVSGVFDGIENSIRRTLKEINRNIILQYFFAFGFLFSLMVTFLSGEHMIKNVSISIVAVTIIYALLIIILSNLLLYGFQHFDVNIGTVILSMEFVFTLLIGVILYKEIPTQKEFFGGFLIFTASVLTGISAKKSRMKFKK